MVLVLLSCPDEVVDCIISFILLILAIQYIVELNCLLLCKEPTKYSYPSLIVCKRREEKNFAPIRLLYIFLWFFHSTALLR